MRIKVLFFGQLKDIVGAGEDSLDVPEDGQLQTVFEHYASKFPALAALNSSIVLARNHQFCERQEKISAGDEVAFLPPVSGGSAPADLSRYTHQLVDEPAGHFFALTREPIDSKELRARLLQGEDGAFVDFEGVVRNNTKGRATKFLDYECYEPMALKMMAEIGRSIAATHSIGRIGIVHRLGRMEIGDTSVVVFVTAPHRKPAFEAALEGINRLKKIVPIWKKEHFVDGEVWVEGDWDASVLQP